MSLTTFLILTCVCTALGNKTSPLKYDVLLKDYENAADVTKELVKATDNDPVTSLKRQYALLATVVVKLAHYMTAYCANYDASYLIAVNEGVPEGWLHPARVAVQLRSVINTINNQIKDVQDLVLQECKGLVGLGDENCNKQVQVKVEADPKKYQNGAKVLEVVGRLSNLYLQETYEDFAHKKRIVSLLLTNGQKKLKDLVLTAAELETVVLKKPLNSTVC